MTHSVQLCRSRWKPTAFRAGGCAFQCVISHVFEEYFSRIDLRTQPYDDVLGSVKELPHLRDLTALFYIISLIDTDSIYPHDEGLGRVPQVKQGFVEISCDWQSAVIELDLVWWIRITPGV